MGPVTRSQSAALRRRALGHNVSTESNVSSQPASDDEPNRDEDESCNRSLPPPEAEDTPHEPNALHESHASPKTKTRFCVWLSRFAIVFVVLVAILVGFLIGFLAGCLATVSLLGPATSPAPSASPRSFAWSPPPPPEALFPELEGTGPHDFVFLSPIHLDVFGVDMAMPVSPEQAEDCRRQVGQGYRRLSRIWHPDTCKYKAKAIMSRDQCVEVYMQLKDRYEQALRQCGTV